MEVSSVGAEAVIREFAEHRFDRSAEDGEAPLAAADEGFFADLVRAVEQGVYVSPSLEVSCVTRPLASTVSR